MYMFLKHLHMTTLAVSVSLLVLRFIWSLCGAKIMQRRWVKIVPHINDTVLLLSGAGLMVVTGFYPFTPHTVWMTEKLLGVVIYILLGFVALKEGKNKVIRLFALLGALGWIWLIAQLAITKTPLWFS
ncbi:MAG: SirB2 family protein [Plesiomonas sp.]|uniref:SirB2 family protein n=1 Tax=Plesiomonas sp. TaxID=2486279 RepID=UPI003EE7A58D